MNVYLLTEIAQVCAINIERARALHMLDRSFLLHGLNVYY